MDYFKLSVSKSCMTHVTTVSFSCAGSGLCLLAEESNSYFVIFSDLHC
jgi:hypothetical protein